MTESLERYINRKKLFIRVQANVPRELFVQRLTSAFSGARIGVGQDRGPVSQRVADITFDTAAEATQALRRNRFKLKIGNHDADITYQIERKDIVEKLAGEWGCRFMVVVKNLPSGEVSCSELADTFETVGEIFNIKILPGNRGEPYALVQYVEEQSVEQCIQSINQQKLHGAVLCVERHLKARRPPSISAPTPSGHQGLSSPTSSYNNSHSSHHNSHSSHAAHGHNGSNNHHSANAGQHGQTQSQGAAQQHASQAKPPSAAAVLTGHHQSAPGATNAPNPSQNSGGAVNGNVSHNPAAYATARSTPGNLGAGLAGQSSTNTGSLSQQASQSQQAGQDTSGLNMPDYSPFSPRALSNNNETLLNAYSAGVPSAFSLAVDTNTGAYLAEQTLSAVGSPKSPHMMGSHPILSANSLEDTSNSFFSVPIGKSEQAGSMAIMSGNMGVLHGTEGHSNTASTASMEAAVSHLGIFGTDLSNGVANGLGSALSASPPVMNPSANNSLGMDMGCLNQTISGLGLGLGGMNEDRSSSHNQVLTPVLDLFSHLRESNHQNNANGNTAGLPQATSIQASVGGVDRSHSMSNSQLANNSKMLIAGGSSGGNTGSSNQGSAFGSYPPQSNLTVNTTPFSMNGPISGGASLLSPTSSQPARQSTSSGLPNGIADTTSSSFFSQAPQVPSSSLADIMSPTAQQASRAMSAAPTPTAGNAFALGSSYGAGSAGLTGVASPRHPGSSGNNNITNSVLRKHSIQQPGAGGSILSSSLQSGNPCLPPTALGLSLGMHSVSGVPVTLSSPTAGSAGGVNRITIRDTLRLALGRLEEIVTCPLTGEMMRDPVIAADGVTYERAAIQAWLSNHGAVSPVSSDPLPHKVLITNRLAKDVIADILP